MKRNPFVYFTRVDGSGGNLPGVPAIRRGKRNLPECLWDVDEGLVKVGNDALNEEMINYGDSYPDDEEDLEGGRGQGDEGDEGGVDEAMEVAKRTAADAHSFFGRLNRTSQLTHTSGSPLTSGGKEKVQSFRQVRKTTATPPHYLQLTTSSHHSFTLLRPRRLRAHWVEGENGRGVR